MKSVLSLFFLQIFLLSCAGMHKKYDVAVFGEYVKRFENYSGIYGQQIIVTDLVIEFGVLNDEIIGLCSKFDTKSPLITIDIEWWNDSKRTDTEREILMLHELGHCVLNRDHNDNVLPNGFKESIMHYRLIHWGHYFMEKGRYLNELFNGQPNPIERNDSCY